MWTGVIRRYRDLLPIEDEASIVSLNEGDTPLVPAPYLASLLGEGIEVFLKVEGLNPTGSFKDRGMTVAVSKAKEEGAKAVICASTGNTAAAAAAYAARAGMKAFVIVPEGKVALGKLSASLSYGARVIQIRDGFDLALRFVRRAAEELPVTLVNSVNPYRIEGQTTAAYEICDDLGRAPDWHALPVGNAGNITAYWAGYGRYADAGRINSKPAMLGFQAAGAAPIVLGHPVEQPETVATAIRIGHPASWKGAEAARDESGGLIQTVTDAEILAAYKLLASREGVFCEPASAAGAAGALKLAQEGYFQGKAGTLVCTLTGHGLKDPDTAIAQAGKPATVAAEFDAVVEAMGL